MCDVWVGDGATVVAGSLNVINEAAMTHSARACGDRLRLEDKGLRKSSPFLSAYARATRVQIRLCA